MQGTIRACPGGLGQAASPSGEMNLSFGGYSTLPTPSEKVKLSIWTWRRGAGCVFFF